MRHSEAALTAWDAATGDGDCGANAYGGGTALVKHAEEESRRNASEGEGEGARGGRLNVSEALWGLSQVVDGSMGGSSGVLYCLILDSAAGVFQRAQSSAVDARIWVEAFEAGVEAVMRYGGAKPGDRTMVDALHALLGQLKQDPWDLVKAKQAVVEGILSFYIFLYIHIFFLVIS
jgi:hypothetical protein